MRFFSLFVVIVTVTGISCQSKTKQTSSATAINAYQTANDFIAEGMQLIKDGDLILRNGQEFSSQVVKNFNRNDKTYSHAGLVFFKNGYPYVWHIVPGDENPDLKLRADSLLRFCNPRRNAGFAIYRYDLDTTEIKKLQTIIHDWHNAGVSFDSTFDMRTNDRMYCSEMIKKGLAKATHGRIQINTVRPSESEAIFFATNLRAPLSYVRALDLVPVDALFLTPHCRQVKRFNFLPGNKL